MATRIPIPLGQQRQSTPLGMPAARAPMVAVEDPTGRAVAGLGQAVGQIGSAVREVEKEDARVWASTTSSNDRVKWLQRMRELKGTAEPGAPNFTPTVLGEYDEYTEQALANAPELAKPFYREMLQREREYVVRQAIDFEDRQRHAYNVNQYEQGAQSDARVVASDPSRYDEILVARQAALSTAMLDPDVKMKLWENTQTLLSIAAETSAMQANPQSWLMSRRPGVAGAIQTSAEMAGIDPAYMLAVADIETGGTFDPSAKNPRSTAGGLFQFTDATWKQYAEGQDKKDAVANARAAADFTADNRKSLSRSLGRQPAGWEMYLAHQQGAGGAAALLNASPETTVAKALEDAGIPNARRAANDNGMADMTVEQALSMWKGKFDRAYQKHSGALPAETQAGQSGVNSFDNLDWATQNKLEQQASTLMRQRQSEEKALIQDQVRDQEASWLSGQDYDGPLVSKGQFLAAYGVQEGLERWSKHQDIYRTGQDIRALTALSNAEIQQSVMARQPVGGPGFEDAAKRFDIYQRAAQAVVKERQTDPAAYVLNNNDSIRASFEAMRTAMDPSSLQQAAKEYASKALSEQGRLGIQSPRLLSSNQAEAIVQSFYDQREGARDAADLIVGLEHQWGDNWPLVFEQLSESGKLPRAALVIPNMKDPGARVRTARRALVDEKIYKDRLDSTAPKDIEERLTKKMADMWESFFNQNGGENSYQAVYGEARKAALEYAANGKSVSEAVSQAYDEFVGQSYEFADGYRIPIEQDPDQVQRGARKVVQQIAEMDLLIPESEFYPGMPLEARKSAWVDSVKANHVFVTDGKEEGLVLYTMAANGLTAVEDRYGRPIRYTWEDLRNAVKPIDRAKDLIDQVPYYVSEQYR